MSANTIESFSLFDVLIRISFFSSSLYAFALAAAAQNVCLSIVDRNAMKYNKEPKELYTKSNVFSFIINIVIVCNGFTVTIHVIRVFDYIHKIWR